MKKGRLVDRMKDFHSRMLNTLGLINADRSLPEGEEYEQLELRVGDQMRQRGS